MKSKTVAIAKKINGKWEVVSRNQVFAEKYLLKLVANSAINNFCLN